MTKRQSFIRFATAITCLACCSYRSNAAPHLSLTENGRSPYVIALAHDAIPAEKTAARQFSEYVQKISGARLPIKPEGQVPAGQPQVLIGSGIRVKKMLPGQNWKALGTDGIVVKTVGRNLILAGGRPRGSLYAVSTFLENNLGVRWWTPAESKIPKRSTIGIAAQNTIYIPSIKTREALYRSVQVDPLFSTFLRMNGHFQTQGPELGGHNSILGLVHTFDKLLPPEKYFKDHPEWYSDIENGGKPCTANSKMPHPQTSQLCLTNEAARRELTKNALAWIRENPAAGMISISQNDNANRCTAEADLAIEKREGSPAGPLLEFVNAVAADIEKEFPGFLVETLAYQYTRKPPLTVRPRRNVVIRLCSLEADFARPLVSAANTAFRDDVLGWKAIAPRLYIWDYVTNFSNVILPHPNLRVLGPNVRFFAANNVIGLFEQGDAHSNGTGDFVAMRLWLLAQMMWNPKLDQAKLETEFLQGYYGPAAPHLRAYLDAVQDSFLATGKPLSTFQEDLSYLTLDVLNRATRHYRAAETAVAADPVLARRVRRERLALDHAWIQRYKALRREVALAGGDSEMPGDMKAFTADFVKTAREFGADQYRENGKFEEYATSLLTRFESPAPLPDFARGLPANDVIDLQESEFRLISIPGNVGMAEDTLASNARAAWTSGKIKDWLLQIPLNEDAAFLGTSHWRCYAIARVDAKGGATPGPVLSAGLYDVKNKVEPANLTRTLADMAAGEYRALDLGTHRLHPDMYFWVAGHGRDDIEKVYVDRLVLVREGTDAKP